MGCEIQKSRAKAFDAGQGGTGSVIVRAVRAADADAWLQMREALWPGDIDAHRADIGRFFANGAPGLQARGLNEAALVAERDGVLVGFVELSHRAYAQGCESSPVAYVEGWFVSPEARGAGVGRTLLQAAEEWGRATGCTEFASDAEASNVDGVRAHLAYGFVEAPQIRCFRKKL